MASAIKTALIASLFAASVAAAGTLEVSIRPATQTVLLGSQVTVELWWDFSGEPALGGGVDVGYDDAALDFVSFTFTTDPAIDPAFSRPPADLAGLLTGIAAGEFTSGVAGPVLIGTLVFDAVSIGTKNITPAQTVDPSVGPFVSYLGLAPYAPATITFTAAQVVVSGEELIFASSFEDAN